MGHQERVRHPMGVNFLMAVLIEGRVVAAGYEDEFGSFRRIAQHAL